MRMLELIVNVVEINSALTLNDLLTSVFGRVTIQFLDMVGV